LSAGARIDESLVEAFEQDGVALLRNVRGSEQADRDAWPIVGWEMQPGDAVAFNMLTPHAAAGSPTRRRAFSLRLIGDDVRWAPRPHRTSPPFDELDGVLAAGAPLEHELFPVLWREIPPEERRIRDSNIPAKQGLFRFQVRIWVRTARTRHAPSATLLWTWLSTRSWS
jgi:hypothetical protein